MSAAPQPATLPRWAQLQAWQASTWYGYGERAINDSGKLYGATSAGQSAGSGGPTGTGGSITDGGVTWQYLGMVAPAWVGSHSYSQGDRVSNGGSLYLCLVAGTSASSGGPAGTGEVVDGGATWIYLSASTAVVVAPTSGQQDVGWAVSQRPPSTVFNWFFNLTYRWLLYLQDLADQSWTWTAAHVFSAGIQVGNSTTNGVGVTASGDGTGAGVAGTGGATAPGVKGTGGGSGQVGVLGTGGANAAGVQGAGTGSGAGVTATGGATGPGVSGTGGGGSQVGVLGTGGANAAGVKGQGTGTGPGVYARGGILGAGVEAYGNGTSALAAFAGSLVEPTVKVMNAGATPRLRWFTDPNGLQSGRLSRFVESWYAPESVSVSGGSGSNTASTVHPLWYTQITGNGTAYSNDGTNGGLADVSIGAPYLVLDNALTNNGEMSWYFSRPLGCLPAFGTLVLEFSVALYAVTGSPNAYLYAGLCNGNPGDPTSATDAAWIQNNLGAVSDPWKYQVQGSGHSTVGPTSVGGGSVTLTSPPTWKQCRIELHGSASPVGVTSGSATVSFYVDGGTKQAISSYAPAGAMRLFFGVKRNGAGAGNTRLAISEVRLSNVEYDNPQPF